MKTKLVLSFILLLCIRLSAQTAISSASFVSVWAIDSGAFPDNIVKLKAYEASKDSSRTFSGYEFSKDGKVTIVNHTAGNLAFCGNGAPYIKRGTWFYNKKYIRIKVSGGYLAAGTISYDLVYKVASFSNGLLVLKKTKTYKNKRCEACNESSLDKKDQK